MTRTRPHARNPKRDSARITPVPSRDGRDGVRSGRVVTARARITAGYYERADVQDLVVRAVLAELRRH